jgi:hypothetical protein
MAAGLSLGWHSHEFADIHGVCGRNRLCTYIPKLECVYLKVYYEMVETNDWSQGCKHKGIMITNGKWSKDSKDKGKQHGQAGVFIQEAPWN